MAALESIRRKDLVAEGLRLALEQREKHSKVRGPLEVLQEIRRDPRHSSEGIARLMDANRRLRAEGWSQGDRE